MLERPFPGSAENGVRAPGMRTILVLVVILIAVRAHGDAGLKAGWTAENLADATSSCSDTLIEGAWANTKREQGVDPAKPMTPEIREQLAPQMAAMRKLCACAVREAAKRYSKAEAEKSPKDLDRFVADTVASGKCKLEQ